MLISLYVDVNVVEGPEFGPKDMTGGRVAMVVQGILGKAAGTVVTGLVGVSAYEVLRKTLAKAPLHEAAVSATEWSLRGTRRAEEAAESARLKLADGVAEPRDPLVKEAHPPPLTRHT